ncbi:Uncharacterized protein OBRU01_12579 [Operophtera brumata]|uniref:Uncharacterized protein n=1 Tax=Operophtera brumata TaxID=104452 RepID=A0A0L7L9T1_OPEBR|nr:Uncharacterized protein OBRU01_12579 [Operophtera brumata]
MDSSQKSSSCIGGGAPNTCFDQPVPFTPYHLHPASFSLLAFSYIRGKCAMLRAELVEKERCQHRELQNRLHALEMKFEGTWCR